MKIKRIIAALTAAVTLVGFAGCTDDATDTNNAYTVGICNYVDDASLNQIVDSIKTRLGEIEGEKNVSFKIDYDNCNADANLMNQIIANFTADNADIMVGVATPVAMAMQAATEGTDTPVVFAAVSDPESVGLVENSQNPGANITGTSDYLNTDAIFELMLALQPDIKKVGLLYDIGQDSSKTPIEDAKRLLAEKNIEIVERTGTTVDEIMLAAQSLVSAGVDAVFTPTDNTVMKAELSIYETLADAGIPHYTGADSFALNGAFLGYGVDYEELGRDTADMIASILLDEKNPASTPVLYFDNGIATVNTEIADKLGYSYDELKEKIIPFCTKVKPITTAEEFGDLEG